MIVCLCHRISERDIEHHARDGCDSFAALQQRTHVATRCGTCQDFAQETFARVCTTAPCIRPDCAHAERRCEAAHA